jgi:flagellar basal-body rod protein FlgB
VLIDGLSNAGSMPALELAMRYAARRQDVIAHNIANLDTPGFVAMDVRPAEFQRVLGEAIDRRRAGGNAGGLEWDETREMRRGADGGLRLEPRTPAGGVLFHDRGNRDVERQMQDLAENAGMFRLASEMMRGRVGMMRNAIAERVA